MQAFVNAEENIGAFVEGWGGVGHCSPRHGGSEVKFWPFHCPGHIPIVLPQKDPVLPPPQCL